MTELAMGHESESATTVLTYLWGYHTRTAVKPAPIIPTLNIGIGYRVGLTCLRSVYERGYVRLAGI